MRRAHTSTLRNPNSTKGIPSVMPRDKGSTCAPGAERTSVLWRMSSCTIGSSAAWEARDSRGSAQTTDTTRTPLVVVSANRCGGLCRRAAMRRWRVCIWCKRHYRASVHGLTITRTCPRSSARRGSSCSDIRLATQTMKPLLRGAPGTCLQTGRCQKSPQRQPQRRGPWDGVRRLAPAFVSSPATMK